MANYPGGAGLPEHGGNAIEVVNLTKKFGSLVAVNNVSFTVPRGEIFGYLGLNGAGKTTTIRVLAGMMRAQYERITIAGCDLATQRMQVKAVIGVVPDEPGFYEMLSGRIFLRYIGAMYGLYGKDLAARVDEVVAQMGLEKEADRAILTYSKGMRQRTAIGAAIIHQPQVLLMDEPFTGIDAYQTHSIKGLLREFAAQGGTVLMCSHQMEMVEGLCTSFAIIQEGRILGVQTMAEFNAQHPGVSLEEYLAGFGA
jgi:ABC-2 type transport system ATP-binding protein